VTPVVAVPAVDVRIGDRIRSRGLELTVSRIDRPFLGRDDMLAFVEDTELQWLKLPVAVDAEVERLQA
jgi:hypothetical protein